MRARTRVLRHLTSGLLLLLAACATRPPAEPPAAPAPAIEAPTAPPGGAVTSRLDRLCDDLQRIIEAEADGFAALRTSSRIGPSAWRGAVLPEGTQACTVEGDRHPGAEYICRGETLQGGRAELLEPAFNRLAADLDACFSRAVWFPRNWEKGQVIRFAGGERQQTWRDLAPLPKPAVALKIEEDFKSHVHYVRLAVFTLR